MVKSELITVLAQKLPEITEKDISLSVNLLLDKIGNHLSERERVEVRGFGSFSMRHRPSRNAHNPKTGVHFKTAAKYSEHFKPGKEMRERINESAKNYPIITEGDERE